jgi:hypothetical protein
MCKRAMSNCKTRFRVDLTPSGGDPRDSEQFEAEAVRLASPFPERFIRRLAHELGISDQRDPT